MDVDALIPEKLNVNVLLPDGMYLLTRPGGVQLWCLGCCSHMPDGADQVAANGLDGADQSAGHVCMSMIGILPADGKFPADAGCGWSPRTGNPASAAPWVRVFMTLTDTLDFADEHGAEHRRAHASVGSRAGR